MIEIAILLGVLLMIYTAWSLDHYISRHLDLRRGREPWPDTQLEIPLPPLPMLPAMRECVIHREGAVHIKHDTQRDQTMIWKHGRYIEQQLETDDVYVHTDAVELSTLTSNAITSSKLADQSISSEKFGKRPVRSNCINCSAPLRSYICDYCSSRNL